MSLSKKEYNREYKRRTEQSCLGKNYEAKKARSLRYSRSVLAKAKRKAKTDITKITIKPNYSAYPSTLAGRVQACKDETLKIKNQLIEKYVKHFTDLQNLSN